MILKRHAARRSQAPRALVAVSDPETRDRVVRAVEACRFLVETSAEWTETMARVESERFDVVVAEVEMPVAGGFDVLRAIRYNRPGTVVVLIGEASGDEIVARARNLGAAEYVHKPVDEHRLGIQIRTAWEEKANRQMLRSLGIKGGKLSMVTGRSSAAQGRSSAAQGR